MCTLCRVYLARWREIDVACKLLLGAAADLNTEAAASASLSFSNPLLRSLREASDRVPAGEREVPAGSMCGSILSILHCLGALMLK